MSEVTTTAAQATESRAGSPRRLSSYGNHHNRKGGRVGHENLRAKNAAANGEPAVKVEAPRYLTLDEAARALAVTYETSPRFSGEMQVRIGLHTAVKQQAHRRPDPPEAELTAHYASVLRRHWAKFFRFVFDEAQDKYVSVKRAGLDQEEATHCRIDEPRIFTREEAARALALVHEGGWPRRVGLKTLHLGLVEAARGRVLESGREPDPELVARFDDALGEFVDWSGE